MPTKILKRLNEPARNFHVLLRELLVYSLGWGDIEATPLANFETPAATGSDGETMASAPNRLRSGSAPFLGAHVGLYLTVYGSEFINNGVYKIIGVPSADEVVVEGGLFGATFVDDLSVQFRVVDPTLNGAGDSEYIVQGLAGSASPLWQVRIFVTNIVDDTIEFEVGPQGGWVAGFTLPALPTGAIVADTTQTWYALIEDTHIRLFTQNAAGTAVFQIAYIGGAETRRPATDDRFVISFGGSPAVSALGSLASIDSLDQALGTAITYSALTYGDSVQQNMFASIAATGSITTIAKASLVDAETFTLDDGVNTPTVFEFDVPPDGVTGGNVVVDISGDTTDDDVRDTIIAAINGVAALDITAGNGGAATVTLINDRGGTAGNTISSETVVNVGFILTDMTGGLDLPLGDSVFDIRRDSAKIPLGTEAGGFEEEDRGYLRGFRYISDQIAYRSFVDNGRLVLSLGNGLAIEWDGSLSR